MMTLHVNKKDDDGKEWVDIELQTDKAPIETEIVCVRYTIYIEDIDLSYVACSGFYKNHNNKAWGCDRLETNKFKELSEMTIKLTMELVDVFDVWNLVD